MAYSNMSEQANVKAFAEKMKLENLTPEIDITERKLTTYLALIHIYTGERNYEFYVCRLFVKGL